MVVSYTTILVCEFKVKYPIIFSLGQFSVKQLYSVQCHLGSIISSPDRYALVSERCVSVTANQLCVIALVAKIPLGLSQWSNKSFFKAQLRASVV